MKKLKSYQIRQLWLDFWKTKEHDIIPSASLIPVNDPTLLWINAGVAPLKKYFDGREIPNNKRMANAQKCIRTNDIDNVGKTARHHTFFEMLGNFSIGDYFRKEVLPWALEFLTSQEWLGLDINKLYFTYYPSDQETVAIWKSCGVSENHLIAVEGNFWEIGEGPCGPDTEIFYDRGLKYDNNNIGTKLIEDDIENDRYIEIWNIVFSQYNAKSGLSRHQYPELPSKNIDTGSGLERLTCIIQEVKTNYDTDLFMDIIQATEKITNQLYQGEIAFKVISDHLRSTVFALSDGAVFSNEGRGYVLRRMLRRAVRYGRFLGMNEAFLYKLIPACINNMQHFYSYLLEKEAVVTEQIKQEEEKFLLTLESGEKRLLDYIKNNQEKIINKETAFLLYDTFGFPLELTLEVASENDFKVDIDGFNDELQKQKQRARNARTNLQSMNIQNPDMLSFLDYSEFVGYNITDVTTKIIGIFKDGQLQEKSHGKVLIVFEKTPFYAEMGGQVGDQGYILVNGEKFLAEDTIRLPNGQHGTIIDMKTTAVAINDTVYCSIDREERLQITKNHSATHLLNQALKEVLGNHVEQKGSYVCSQNLRFDFNNYSPPTVEQILLIEKLVNQQITAKQKVKIFETSLDEAKKLGVQALFGEKYGPTVRVVDMTFSKELCGGTHVNNTKEIGSFVILNIESKGSGLYRISATTDQQIINGLNNQLASIIKEISHLEKKNSELLKLAQEQKISNDYCVTTLPQLLPTYQTIINYQESLEQIKEISKGLEKEISKKIIEKSALNINDFLKEVQIINNTKVIVTQIKESFCSLEQNVKDLVDRLSDKLGDCVIVIAIVSEKVVFVVKSKTPKIHAGQLAKMAANITEGNGGGRPDFAQAGGKNVNKVCEALEMVKKELESKL